MIDNLIAEGIEEPYTNTLLVFRVLSCVAIPFSIELQLDSIAIVIFSIGRWKAKNSFSDPVLGVGSRLVSDLIGASQPLMHLLLHTPDPGRFIQGLRHKAAGLDQVPHS